jgi:putative transposase
MLRGFSFSINEFYHLYNRGTDKRIIFQTPSDYERFVALLYLCNGKASIVLRDIPKEDFFTFERGETLVDIGAYCLMPNHFHLLLREKINSGISVFMKKLLTAYSMYFNKKNKRTGSLFEGTYKARHADNDNYLKYLFSYIHLNPAKKIDTDWRTNIHTNRLKIFDFINRYPFSSFPDYRGVTRKEEVILNKRVFPDYFETHKDVMRSLTDWLEYLTTKDYPM